MTNEMTETMIPEITSAIIADKCRGDAAFAKDLKSNPVASLESKLDISLKDSGVDIRVAQNTPEQVHVVLPHYTNVEEVYSATQLTEEEMAQLAGGEVVVTALIVTGVVLLVALPTLAIAGGIAVAVASMYSEEFRGGPTLGSGEDSI